MNGLFGLIFDIQRFALHDGPGIRTTVFMKGCSNCCDWCHNPESISDIPQIQYYSDRCINCGKCLETCPQKCHSLLNDCHAFYKDSCTGCGMCTKTCYANALVQSGNFVTAEYVIEEALKDIAYYKQSKGGVTLSGGEPVLQNEFCFEVLKRLKQYEIHTVLQTAGNYDFGKLESLVPFLDIVMYDVKAYSQDIYDRHIHGNREMMLGNLIKLDRLNIPIIVRTPVIGSINDNSGEIDSIADFLQSIKNLKQYILLPYHTLGRAKYEALGQRTRADYFTPGKEIMLKLKEIAAKFLPVDEH